MQPVPGELGQHRSLIIVMKHPVLPSMNKWDVELKPQHISISRTPLSNLARMAQSLRGLYYWPIGEHFDSRLSAAIELNPEYVSMHVWWLPGSNNSTCQSSEVQPPAHFPQSAPLARYGPRSWVHTSKKSYSDPIP